MAGWDRGTIPAKAWLRGVVKKSMKLTCFSFSFSFFFPFFFPPIFLPTCKPVELLLSEEGKEDIFKKRGRERIIGLLFRERKQGSSAIAP